MFKRPTLTFTWSDEMDVGIPEIDEDHKPIIISINEFNRSITEGKDPTEIKRHLQLVIDETIQHFSQEEELFKEWQYSEATSHARLHAHILKAMQGIKNGFIPYGPDSSWRRVGITIKVILVEHFKNEDVKYAEFRQAGIE
jgi:hemerythrin-like metal-binding protein